MKDGQITCRIINNPPRPEHLVLMAVSIGTRLTVLMHQDGHTKLKCRPKFTSRNSQRERWRSPTGILPAIRTVVVTIGTASTGLAICIVVTGLALGRLAAPPSMCAVQLLRAMFFLSEKGIGPSPHQANHTQQISNIGGSRPRDGTTARSRRGH